MNARWHMSTKTVQLTKTIVTVVCMFHFTLTLRVYMLNFILLQPFLISAINTDVHSNTELYQLMNTPHPIKKNIIKMCNTFVKDKG